MAAMAEAGASVPGYRVLVGYRQRQTHAHLGASLGYAMRYSGHVAEPTVMRFLS